MSVKYLDEDDLPKYVYQYAEETDFETFQTLIPRVSAVFDRLCDLPPGYFSKRDPEAEATEKVLYGVGSVFLDLPPHVGPIVAADVAMPTGYVVPKFIDNGSSLAIVTSSGELVSRLSGYDWPSGVPITVTAKWGFEDVPDDVKEAVAELLVATWRSKDTAFLRTIQLDNQQTLAQALPDRVKMIVASYRKAPAGAAFV